MSKVQIMTGQIESAGVAATELQAVVIEDAAQQSAMQPWAPMECFQLSGGSRVAQMDILKLDQQRLVRERQYASVQKVGIMPKGLCTFSLSRTRPLRFNDLRSDGDDTVYFLPEETEFDIRVPAGGETTYVSFRQDDFLEAARTLDPANWQIPPRHLTPKHTRQKAAFWEAADHWFRIARGHVSAAPDAGVLQSVIFDTVMKVATASPPEEVSDIGHTDRIRASQTCRAARGYMEECLRDDHLPTIVELCRVLNVSERALQYGFLEYANLTPTAYLRHIRLNWARAALRKTDPHETTVTDTALRYGFLHLGRFARDYKAFFGVFPSETLAS